MSNDQPKGVSRREFVKQTIIGTAMLAGASSAPLEAAFPQRDLTRAVVGELGGVFIPSRPGDPGYKDLESYRITEYVLKTLEVIEPEENYKRSGIASEGAAHGTGDGLLEEFNNTAKPFFEGKSFLELDEQQKEHYLELINDGSKITDAELRSKLQLFYRAARNRILTVYYQNYPQHEVKRDAHGVPILKPGDTHQITNPNTKKLVTGWDVAGFNGPMEWEEEEQQRTKMKKVSPYWFEGDLVRRNNVQAAPAIKTGDGKDYYDVVVIGAGTAGCIVAGRLAERGINPKTGDRLRVAVIEGGDDWTVRDPSIRPGYGSPIRRQMTTNINYEELGVEGPIPPGYHWPWDGTNLKLVGGCVMHYGGECFMHTEEDFNIFRRTSGVDWTYGRFSEAIDEVREMYHVSSLPEETWDRGGKLFAEAARGMGFDVFPGPHAYRNCLDSGYCGVGHLCRYDAKGTSLPWLYVGLNNGLKLIPNAEVLKINIEKPVGAAPVATGVVYQDKSGTQHEIRAARIVVATGTVGMAMLLYKSGYGPREFLGTNLIVENKNVGANLDGDSTTAHTSAYFPEPIRKARWGSAFGIFYHKPQNPRGELEVTMTGLQVKMGSRQYPHAYANSSFAPRNGMEHKKWMRDGGWLRVGMTEARLQVIPWSWHVTPKGQMERVSYDNARITAAAKDAAELSYALYEKMSLKPLQLDKHLATSVARPEHMAGTARAGSSRENSVCNSEFECHDIDQLLFTSNAVLPRTTYCRGAGPAALSGSYGYRAFLKNHFSKGCSTKGFA